MPMAQILIYFFFFFLVFFHRSDSSKIMKLAQRFLGFQIKLYQIRVYYNAHLLPLSACSPYWFPFKLLSFVSCLEKSKGKSQRWVTSPSTISWATDIRESQKSQVQAGACAQKLRQSFSFSTDDPNEFCSQKRAPETKEVGVSASLSRDLWVQQERKLTQEIS